MTEIVKFPVEKVYPDIVREVCEIEAQEVPSKEMVWALCPYLRRHADDSRCRRCPSSVFDADLGEEMVRGCYGVAEEACRIVFTMQSRAAREAAP
jgi:hypothetical protein